MREARKNVHLVLVLPEGSQSGQVLSGIMILDSGDDDFVGA